MKPLDSIDHHILNLLQEDSTEAIKEVAEKVGLSFTATYERIKNLKLNGFIQKYVAIINPDKCGFGIIAYSNITLKEQSIKKLHEFETKIQNNPKILEMISLSGTYDYMIKVVAKDIKDYNNFMTTMITNFPNISQFHSNIVLSTIKSETKYTL